jgi:hypothetical protein
MKFIGTVGLKACKCGSESLSLDQRDHRFGFAVRCKDCGAMTPWAALTSVARALWNRGDRQPTITVKDEGLRREDGVAQVAGPKGKLP